MNAQGNRPLRDAKAADPVEHDHDWKSGVIHTSLCSEYSTCPFQTLHLRDICANDTATVTAGVVTVSRRTYNKGVEVSKQGKTVTVKLSRGVAEDILCLETGPLRPVAWNFRLN